MTFDPNFIFYRDPREVIAWETLDDMAAEADAELTSRRKLYPALIVKGRLSQRDADRELRVMTVIANKLALRPATLEATWEERVHCLRREIALRRLLYPQWILAGRVDPDEAARKLRMMESIHDMTWHGDCTPEAKAIRAVTMALAA
jgi:hypothetical protein